MVVRKGERDPEILRRAALITFERWAPSLALGPPENRQSVAGVDCK